MTVIEEIAAERKHQIEDHGYDESHDDEHVKQEIAWAAVSYIAPGQVYILEKNNNTVVFKDPWPWSQVFDARPCGGNGVTLTGNQMDAEDRRHILIKAGAMLVAEIERLDRRRLFLLHGISEVAK